MEACRRRTATKTTAATADSANVTQEEALGAEVFNVLQRMTGSISGFKTFIVIYFVPKTTDLRLIFLIPEPLPKPKLILT